INSVGLSNYSKNINFGADKPAPDSSYSMTPLAHTLSSFSINKDNVSALAPVSTKLSSDEETKMYNEVVNAFITSDTEKISPQDDISRQKKLDSLLKSGILLNRNSNDKSSVLENIHKTITTPRAADLDGVKTAGLIVDALYNPAVIRQEFGDIPKEAQAYVNGKQTAPVNVEGSGTCVAASVEFHMANKHQAEFARWAESLTSPEVSVEKNIDLSALSQNKMDAFWFLKEFNAPVENFDFNKAKLNLKPDENAITRVQIQDNFWDKGERNYLDVLFQSTLMQLGSQQTYDSLTDTRGVGKFNNSNPQGLIEFEKTFIESVVENAERTSVVYQNVDMDQNLTGWVCPLEDIQKNIIDAIDSKEDVIVGYVLTAGECGEKSQNPNKIVNGHEITIVDYKKDTNGNLVFICNDTDDNKSELIEYSADFLLPKIHHASYSTDILKSSSPQLYQNAAQS
ncbi:MAG: hypothetical protein LUE64_02615, partial [Candidatus Gastranaerophilales bacterium]|nr:hypothetical protein [Candidatus Gastranaerophilales bacterium]